MQAILLSVAVSAAVNGAFFAIAAVKKTDAVTDLSYSLSFALLTAALLVIFNAFDPFRLLAAGMVGLWALRLGAYLFGRIMRMKVDHRFDAIRDKPLAFSRFWILQAITVAIVMLPVSLALANGDILAPGPLSLFGLALWAIGLSIEAVADAQKIAFKKAGKSGFIDTGLWSLSRHPNYFGESLLWIGIYVYCLPALGSGALPALASPAGITALLLFVSGIPPLEKAADRKYGGQEHYEAYKRATSIFIPLPPRKPIQD